MTSTTMPATAQGSEEAPTVVTAGMNKLAIFSIFLSHITVDMQTGSLAILLPLLLTTFHLDYTWTTLIVTLNNVVIAMAQPLFGILGDRKPMRWLLFVGCLLCGLAMSTVLFQPNYWWVLVAVVLSGLGSAAFHPEALSAIRAASGERSVSATSFFFFGGNLGFALGPMLATWLTTRFPPGAIIWMLLPTTLGFLALFLDRRAILSPVISKAATRHVSTRSTRRLVLLVSFLLTLIALRSMIMSSLQTFMPLYYDKYDHMPKAQIASLVSTLVLAGTFGTLFGGPISERIGRRVTMAGAMVVAQLALYYFYYYSTGWMMWISLGLAGAFITIAWPISVVLVQEAMPNQVGLASGLTLGLAYGAIGVGVAALGWLADRIGLPLTMNLIIWLPVPVFLMSLFVPERS